jgi:SAM-dependent methyltransferase
LRILSEWVGHGGSVVGSDIGDKMLAGARSFVEAEALGNVALLKGDVFASQLPAGSFDLVHSRFQIAPLGRAPEQINVYRRLVKPGGWIVLEDPDMASWRVNPDAPAVQRLVDLIKEGFRAAGGGFNAVVNFYPSLEASGRATLDAHVVALRPASILATAVTVRDISPTTARSAYWKGRPRRPCAPGGLELSRPSGGTTFTLIQAYASLPV